MAAKVEALITTLAGLLAACGVRSPSDGIVGAATCPRDALRDASGRCACMRGHVLVLGACVPPAVADAYCGPAAKFGAGGCSFRACDEESVLDAANGACVPRTTVVFAGPCGEATQVVAEGRSTCISADAACPRGTRRAGALCDRAPSCPAGALVAGDACRPIVTVGVREDLPRVDLGAWAALVLGPDGGPGASDLCRPLLLRPDAFSLPQGTPSHLRLDIAVTATDEDLTRVHATVRESHLEGAQHELSAEAESLIARSVATLVEPLRGLGGEASTAMVEVRVTCKLDRF